MEAASFLTEAWNRGSNEITGLHRQRVPWICKNLHGLAQRCTDLNRKRETGFLISRICTALHEMGRNPDDAIDVEEVADP